MKEVIAYPVIQLMKLFPGSFINDADELILDRQVNLYFALGNIDTVEEVKYKVIERCSRAACKSMPYRQERRNEEWREKVRNAINKYLGVEFTKEEWMLIYTYLGNSINRPLCVKFFERGYDLEVIREYERQKYPNMKRGQEDGQ